MHPGLLCHQQSVIVHTLDTGNLVRRLELDCHRRRTLAGSDEKRNHVIVVNLFVGDDERVVGRGGQVAQDALPVQVEVQLRV